MEGNPLDEKNSIQNNTVNSRNYRLFFYYDVSSPLPPLLFGMPGAITYPWSLAKSQRGSTPRNDVSAPVMLLVNCTGLGQSLGRSPARSRACAAARATSSERSYGYGTRIRPPKSPSPSFVTFMPAVASKLPPLATPPGVTTAIPTPLCPTSASSASANDRTAALVAAYAANSGTGAYAV